MFNPNTRILTLLLALVMVAACNRIDTAFVEEMQAGISKANENREAFESGMKKVRDLFERMEKAPEGLKNNPKFGYAELYGRVIQLHDAYNSMVANQSQMVSTVEGILADYTDGKLKKEEAKQQAELNLKNFEGYSERVKRMDEFVAEATKSYDAMLAQWEALPEAEKIASAKMPAPTLPDAGSMRGGPTLMSAGSAPAAAPSAPSSATPGVLAPSGAAPQRTAPAPGGPQPGPTPQQLQTGTLAPTPQQQQTGTLAPTPQQQQTGTLAPTPQQQQTGTLAPTPPSSPTAPAPKRGQ
ncbi:MAG: hypothetical protein RMJ33_12860 [Saprospiraceae bacterium]|nr:hypothetical protein [Saprospiraceae bacterium]MDW8230718.1 hypothetical protein [Saprospiraceae bacterium]